MPRAIAVMILYRIFRLSSGKIIYTKRRDLDIFIFSLKKYFISIVKVRSVVACFLEETENIKKPNFEP